jgi:anti-anti-sigma regulatory factor
VIFRFFAKKDARSSERKRGSSTDTVVDTQRDATTGVAPTTLPIGRPADPREVARATAAKIDEIESQMIVRSGVDSLSARPGASQASPAGTVHTPATPVSPMAESVGSAGRAAAPTEVGPFGLSSMSVGTDMQPMEIGGANLPPAFEEAAVLYSNGQTEAAESVLQQAILEPLAGNFARQSWSMLFDLHHLTGNRVAFDSLAIDFSRRFETSPPTWDDTVAGSAVAASPNASGSAAAVALPAVLDAQAARQLEQAKRFSQRNRAITLDLSPVRSVDPDGASLLHQTLAGFAKTKSELTIAGADALLAVVSRTTENGRRDDSDACWLLQLELLRVLGRESVFEDLSIDYCVTYEVSPPPWEPMPASICLAGSKGSAKVVPVAEPTYQVGADAFLLLGSIEGRAQATLSALRSYAADRAEIHVDCRALRRLDFVAAGELLNEVVALRTGGKYLVFKDLNQLVAALLAVMGIPDLAEVRLRRH